jgi:hypothetical protein
MVVATDDQGAFGQSVFIVEVMNLPPIASIMGPPSEVRVGRSFIIMGSGSDTENDNFSLVYRWTLDGVVLSEGPDSKVAIMITRPGEHRIGLTVIDDDMAEGSATPVTVKAIGDGDRSPTHILWILMGTLVLIGFVLVLLMTKVKRIPGPDIEPVLGDDDVMADEENIPNKEKLGPSGSIEGEGTSDDNPVPEMEEMEEPIEMVDIEVSDAPTVDAIVVEPADQTIFD